ncbi:MAG: beta strand repeat-containing protein, partial [Planctomyces sp.]
GTINLTANAFGWTGVGAAVNAGTGTVTLATTTSNWPIVLGAADTGSAVGLDSAELSIITAGTLLIGTTANTQPITISSPVSAATAGNLTLRSSGGIAPTASGTDITLGSGKSLNFSASTSILIAVSGNTADTGYSQLNVAGTLNLTGTMLSLSGSYVPVSGDVLTVASATSVSGTFTGLANNAVTSLNSEPLLVNYTAGTAALTAYVAPVVTTHPVSTGVTAGTVVSFTAAATGVPAPTVQWQVSTNNGSSWSNISGETSGTYTFTAAAGDTGKQYRAVFTNAEGSANTNAATLLVGTLPVFSSRNVMAAGEGVSTGLYIAATASPTPTFSVSAGTLPAGLTLDPVTGLLSGTPAAGTAGGSSQNYSVTILASNGIGGGTTQNLTITITTGIISFDVSKGLSQRSYIRYVDLTLANAATASAIVSSGSRIRLTRTDLDGNSPTTVALNGFVSTVGGRIALDFGTVGIGNARNTSLADGYYTLAVDLDNDGQREAEFAFFRLFGDLNGDRQVNSTDLAIANNGVRSAYSAEADANGDGFVTSSDVLYVQRTLNRRLRNGLWLAD